MPSSATIAKPSLDAAVSIDGSREVGRAAALATVIIWAAWIALTRKGVTTSLAPVDVALLRYSVPSLVLLPVLWRIRPALRQAGTRRSLIMIVGSGAPFFMVCSTGMALAPAADIGTLLPGTMPLFVALFGFLFLRERIGALRLLGFALIFAGAVAVAVGGIGLEGAWRGYPLLLGAASMWACSTLAFRRSGIDAWQSAAIVNTGSVLLLLPVLLFSGTSRLLDAPLHDILLQGLVQGFLSGLLALVCYGAAVRRLGASNAAAFAALAPGLAALFGVPLLGEIPSEIDIAAILIVGLGVALASGAIPRKG
ncbi:DMT family transporter [Hypericibacter sp.]|uniref:DMT family transporter n=1 Tax=Hypericibacter sp. TaxID=2705401 RepID=UPI003D6D8FFD